MEPNSLITALGRAARGAALALGMSQAGAETTSLEITGLLLDGSGNKINAPFITFTEGIYSSATGGTLLATLGPENVHVGDGRFVQIFSVDDSLLDCTYLQVNLNGFDMTQRLGIFFNGSYYFASGETAGGPGRSGLFQMYVGLAALPPVPEPASYMLMLGGAAFMSTWAARRRGKREG